VPVVSAGDVCQSGALGGVVLALEPPGIANRASGSDGVGGTEALSFVWVAGGMGAGAIGTGRIGTLTETGGEAGSVAAEPGGQLGDDQGEEVSPR